MIDWFALTKVAHIISATVLFGTGLGIAFFMFRGSRYPDLHSKYHFARTTVLADYLFTAPSAVIQPATGIALVAITGIDPFEDWLLITYALYALAGLCWLPVVWIQIQLKNILATSMTSNEPLPDRYFRLFRIWFLLGWPAFLSLVAIFYLMVAKPTW